MPACQGMQSDRLLRIFFKNCLSVSQTEFWVLIESVTSKIVFHPEFSRLHPLKSRVAWQQNFTFTEIKGVRRLSRQNIEKCPMQFVKTTQPDGKTLIKGEP